jgi:hypothetical protein
VKYRTNLHKLYEYKHFDVIPLREDITFVPCYYCGAISEEYDHVPPLATLRKARAAEFESLLQHGLVIVPACFTCNRTLAANILTRLDKRKAYIMWKNDGEDNKQIDALINEITDWTLEEAARLPEDFADVIFDGMHAQFLNDPCWSWLWEESCDGTLWQDVEKDQRINIREYSKRFETHFLAQVKLGHDSITSVNLKQVALDARVFRLIFAIINEVGLRDLDRGFRYAETTYFALKLVELPEEQDRNEITVPPKEEFKTLMIRYLNNELWELRDKEINKLKRQRKLNRYERSERAYTQEESDDEEDLD